MSLFSFCKFFSEFSLLDTEEQLFLYYTFSSSVYIFDNLNDKFKNLKIIKYAD